MFHKSTLPNGLRIITTPMPHTRSASVLICVGVGSRYEADPVAGISHFIEHMLFKGTRARPTAREVSEVVESTGGILNAETGRELTVYWAKVPRPAFETTTECLTDMLRNSLFDPRELEKERKVIIEELNMIGDSPAQLADLLIDETLWPDQPLGRDIAGTKDSVTAITREMQLDYLTRHYTPGATVVSIAGNVDPDETVALVESYFGDWQAGSATAMLPAVDGQTAARTRLHSKRTEQAHLCLAVPAYNVDHPDRYALDLLNIVLGEGMSSRLFVELREERGLCYDVHSYVSRFKDTGSLTVYAGIDPKNAEETIRAVLGELARFRDVPVPDDEFTKAKDLVKGRMLLRLEDTRAVASSFGSQELLTGSILTVDDIVPLIDAVSPDDLVRVAGDLFRTDRLNLAIVGNFRKADRFAKLLSL